jgi:multidrug efflux pump
VIDSQENIRSAGFVNGKPAVILDLFRQPQANIIDTADRVLALLPMLRASIPPSMRLEVTEDSTRMIRASVRDVEVTLIISILLVILVVFCSAQCLGYVHPQRGRATVLGWHLRRDVRVALLD